MHVKFHISKGCYTFEGSDLYWYVIPRYQGSGFTRAKVIMYYKHGSYKGHEVDRGTYRLYQDRIKHWVKYA